MITVNLIGSGNVAHHLLHEIIKNNRLILQQVYARRPQNLAIKGLDTKIICDGIQSLKPADVTIISVSDQAIAQVSADLPFSNQLVVHTSGTTNMEAIHKKNRKGVFYPLQTFSKLKKVDFTKIPICLEAENTEDLNLLTTLANELSKEVHHINSQQRKAIHVAAVFVNNFTNHLNTIATDICQQSHIPQGILRPLLEETVEKLKNLPPMDAQTGPALRQDQQTIDAHMAFIQNELTKEIYQKITQSIQEYHGKKL